MDSDAPEVGALTLRKVVGIGSTHHFSLQRNAFETGLPPNSPRKCLATLGQFPPNPSSQRRETPSTTLLLLVQSHSAPHDRTTLDWRLVPTSGDRADVCDA